MTIVYLMRHGEPFKVHRGIEIVDDDLLISNKKSPLSIKGEKLAEEISNYSEFNNIDVVWASDYVRAMSTAKYFAYNNNLKVNISHNLGERKHGVKSWDELPKNFEIYQFEDDHYKIGDGESRKEAQERIYNELMRIIKENKNKRILIVGHSTAFAFLLGKWCEISYDSNYKFNNKVFFDGKWDYLETFKLEFDESYNLVSIKNLTDIL